VGEVFELIPDPRNDPRWCPKVDSVEQVHGAGPGPGSRCVTIHRSVPLRPARAHELEPHADGTRLRQRSDARLGAPKLLHPIWRRGIGKDIAGQLRSLKSLLESST
jgi:hypothetical protein